MGKACPHQQHTQEYPMTDSTLNARHSFRLFAFHLPKRPKFRFFSGFAHVPSTLVRFFELAYIAPFSGENHFGRPGSEEEEIIAAQIAAGEGPMRQP
jgi:hypothetical protein